MFQLLIVDDEKLVADGLAKYINWEKAGFCVAGVAYGVEQALLVIRNKKVDIILTDIIMGEKNGIQLIEEAMLINNEIKGVIVSGHEEFEYAKSAIKLGVYDYLVKPVDFDELESLFMQLSKKMKQNQEETLLGKAEKAEEILGDEQEKSEGVIINTVKDYIHKHYEQQISLQTLSDMVYVHPTYLSILFKKKTGRNFKEYLSEVRINEAKILLDDISLRIIDVSCKVGYDGPKHFSKIFKEETGMTPKDYRNRLQKPVE